MFNAHVSVSGSDRAVSALKATYHRAGLLPRGACLELEAVADTDEAEALTGNPVYAAHWHDGIRTDAALDPAAIAQLVAGLGAWQ